MSWRGVVTRLGLAVVLLAPAACAAPAEPSGRPVLSWHVGPERADVEALAEVCSDASEGRYRIEVERLPDDLDARHGLLVRRLLAEDDSMDLLSLDTSFVPEFAAAQLLAPVPEELAAPLAADVFPAALSASSVDGQLVAAPWWFDPWLLWYRGAAAERAGLDTSEPIAWEDLLAGAARSGRTIQLDDADGHGLTSWVNALVAGAGGTLLEGSGRQPTVGLDTAAGRAAAEVVQRYAEAGLGAGPSPDAAELFASRGGGFLLAPSSVVSDPDLASVAADLEWVPWPTLEGESVAPLDGVSLAVPLYAPRTDLSYDAISCLTSEASMVRLMIGSGHSAARATTYDTDEVAAAYPMADVTREAVETGVALPATPYWQRAREGLLDTWSPVTDVTVGSTPERSQRFVTELVGGGLP